LDKYYKALGDQIKLIGEVPQTARQQMMEMAECQRRELFGEPSTASSEAMHAAESEQRSSCWTADINNDPFAACERHTSNGDETRLSTTDAASTGAEPSSTSPVGFSHTSEHCSYYSFVHLAVEALMQSFFF
jgi:hypothetical protein